MRDHISNNLTPCQRCTIEGQLILLYLQNPAQFPNDGIRYQDQETRGTVAVGNRVRYCNVPPRTLQPMANLKA